MTQSPLGLPDSLHTSALSFCFCSSSARSRTGRVRDTARHASSGPLYLARLTALWLLAARPFGTSLVTTRTSSTSGCRVSLRRPKTLGGGELCPVTTRRGTRSCRSPARDPRQEVVENAGGVEVLGGDLPCALRVPSDVAVHLSEGVGGLLGRAEGEDSLACRYHGTESGVLHHDRSTGGEVAGRPAAEPTWSADHVAVLGHAPLTA